MPNYMQTITHRWKGSPWLPLVYCCAVALFIGTSIMVWYDYAFSVISFEKLPINMPVDGLLFVATLSALPQLVQIVLGYSVAATETSENAQAFFAAIVAISAAVDTTTNVVYFYEPGSGVVGAVTSFVMGLVAFTFFSEFAWIFSAGFLWALKGDFIDQFRRGGGGGGGAVSEHELRAMRRGGRDG